MDNINKHIRLIIILLFICAFLGLAGSVFIFIFISVLSCDSASSILLKCFLMGGFLALISLILFSILPLIAGIGLHKGKYYGKMTAIIYSILILLYFPFGTAGGIYFLIVLSKYDHEKERIAE